MEYTKEGFIKLFDELNDINNEEKEIKEEQLVNYAKELLKNNPNNKELACIVYSGLPHLGYKYYDSLSEELRNDKFVTLLALENFDRTVSGQNIGEDLKNDREVMFSFARNTDGVGSAFYFSDELKRDKEFWVDLLTYAYVSPNTPLDNALFDLEKSNREGKWNLDFDVIYAAANEVRAKGNEYGDSIYSCKISASNLASSNPHFMDEVFKGNVEYVSTEKRFNNFGYAHEIYISEAKKHQKEMLSPEIESSLNKFSSISEVQEIPSIDISQEVKQDNIDIDKMSTYELLKELESLDPSMLSSEQKNYILETEARMQTMEAPEETSGLSR